MQKMCRQRESSPEGAFLSNWKNSRAPFITKVKMALRNNLIKIRNRKNCCGHHGEVGC
jgi:hypothetical protein